MNITKEQFVDIVLESEWMDLAKVYYKKHYPNLIKEANFYKNELSHICSGFPSIVRKVLLCEPLATEYKPIHDKLLEVFDDIDTDKIFGSKDKCCICKTGGVLYENSLVVNSKYYYRHESCVKFFRDDIHPGNLLTDVAVVKEIVMARRRYALANGGPTIFDPETMTTSVAKQPQPKEAVIPSVQVPIKKEISLKEKHIQYFLEELSRPYFRNWRE